MFTFFTYLFYSFAAVFIIWETVRFFGFNSLKTFNELNDKFKEEQEYNKKIDEAEVTDELYGKPKKTEAALGVGLFGCTLFIIVMGYWLWALIGLTTSQWQAFLALVVLSFTYALLQKIVGTDGILSQILLKIDAALSIAILIFILINRFNLGWTF